MFGRSIDFDELADMKLIKAALSQRFPEPLGMLTYMLGKIEALQKREEEKASKKIRSKAKAKAEKDTVNEAGNCAIRIEMDIIKPDFAGLTWEQWKDTHTEVNVYYHNRRNALSSKKRKLEVADRESEQSGDIGNEAGDGGSATASVA
ncbi:hypothetical protein WJX77_003812 [Trebouxia sp. C0004]